MGQFMLKNRLKYYKHDKYHYLTQLEMVNLLIRNKIALLQEN